MSLPGVGPIGLQPNAGNQGANNNAEVAKAVIKEAMETIDTEIMALSGKKELGMKDKDATLTQLQQKEIPQGRTANEVLQHAAQLAAQELLKEKIEEEKDARKNESFEETMESLKHLEGKIDENLVPDEHKGIVRQFFDNMARIKQLRSKLKQLEKEEKKMEELLREEEREEKKKQQDKRP